MNGIYKDTYSADPTNKEELEKLTSGIEDNLSKIFLEMVDLKIYQMYLDYMQLLI